ncbi:MAG TPA: TatD family hydrolase [Candidatus Hydrogenedentes bacterium]|nr:TatD family hydrolase [Candidatus Hydrogenedentota bacterium]
MRLVDSHCHLQDARFDEDRDLVIARALECVEWLVVIGDDLENSRRAADLTGPRVFATVGLHPYNAVHADDAARAVLRELASRPGVVAIGEIGLDYFNEYSPRPAQVAAFEHQLELAATLQLPVVIHNREADADALAILRPYTNRLPGIVMHCFGGDTPFARQCVDLGLYISFAGNVTFPKATRLREAAAATPLDRLLVETDAPYLAPQPVRGKRCEPAHVRYTVETLAGVHGVSPEEIAARTADNARRLFRVA